MSAEWHEEMRGTGYGGSDHAHYILVAPDGTEHHIHDYLRLLNSYYEDAVKWRRWKQAVAQDEAAIKQPPAAPEPEALT